MTPNEYQQLALRTEKRFRMFVMDGDNETPLHELPYGAMAQMREINARLFHGLVGGASEIGESIDPFKKDVIYSKPMDLPNVVEEAGDRLWYMAIELAAVGATLEQAMEANIAKLKKRYPEKYTDHAAVNRDLDGERKVLEDFTTASGGKI